MSTSEPIETCHLIQGWFAFFIQGVLGFMCIMTLVIKRQTEIPRRDWNVWFLDALKQGIGSSFGHFANIFLSVIVNVQEYAVNIDECKWYCLSYLVDSTLGISINLAMITFVETITKRNRDCSKYIKFGEYGNPPSMHLFLPQLAIWLIIVMVTKCITYSLQLYFATELGVMMNFLLFYVESDPKFELVMVMIIIPVTVNSMQFWVTDMILKSSDPTNGSHHHNDDNHSISTRNNHHRLNKYKNKNKNFDHVSDDENSSDDGSMSGILLPLQQQASSTSNLSSPDNISRSRDHNNHAHDNILLLQKVTSSDNSGSRNGDNDESLLLNYPNEDELELGEEHASQRRLLHINNNNNSNNNQSMDTSNNGTSTNNGLDYFITIEGKTIYRRSSSSGRDSKNGNSTINILHSLSTSTAASTTTIGSPSTRNTQYITNNNNSNINGSSLTNTNTSNGLKSPSSHK